MLSLTSAVVKTSPAASCPVAAASELGPERSTIGLPGKDSRSGSTNSELRIFLTKKNIGNQIEWKK